MDQKHDSRPARDQAISSPPDDDDVIGDDSKASRAPAVDRALSILKLLASETMPLGVTEIAKRLDLNPSTCLHVLRALEAASFVQQWRGGKKYILGPGILVLARQVLSKDSFLRDIQPKLARLSERFQCTALVLQPDNEDHFVVTGIAKVEGLLSIHIEMGRRVPTLVAALGRCVAARSGLSEAELKRRFDKLKWASAPDFASWRRQVATARETGIGIDLGNFVAGFSMFSTIVFRGGAIWRAISIVKAGVEFSKQEIDEISFALSQLADEASDYN
ncbi:DNA-binding IclR family transcriptional regulator [Rhizobium aquaticum]|uniref:DNA-binding IclR family transcriptional regulator n=1 Tax=Rhizobium aquaticum TaxID=1549636 RepID=A0ABV2J672_9HYPH